MINKKIIIVLLLLPIFGISQGIHFEKGSFEQALNKAKAENKILFVDGYAVWCGPCKKMAETVFLEKEVGAYFNEHFVSYKLDIEKGNGPKLKQKYRIKGLPGYVFIDGNDEVVYRFDKAMPANEFLAEAQKAVASGSDTNSLARLAERYDINNENEALVASYLNKLSEVKEKNYSDVLEHYLTIQNSIPETSEEMVLLLAKHHNQIVFGGRAEQIINQNIKTDEWKKYVRKDIRQIYQQIPKGMVQNTTEYAIAKQDTTLLELAILNAEKAGFKVDEKQIKRTYTYYYKQIGDGENYKALMHDDIDTYVKSLDKEHLRSYYQEWLVKVAAKDPDALRLTPYAVRNSEQIFLMLKDYVPFVTTKKEKEEVLNWVEVAYYIRPGSAENMSQYADIQYLVGDKNLAIKIKEEAYQAGLKEGLKRVETIKSTLDLMKAGEDIIL